jgi:hypothetical protein
MRVDGRLEWYGNGEEGNVAHSEFKVGAHLECTENTDIEGANGEISVTIHDL